MSIIDDLTPAHYGLEGGKLVVRGTTAATLHFKLLLHFYNDEYKNLGHRDITLTFSTAQKTAFINAIAAALATLEADTGLTRYEPTYSEP